MIILILILLEGALAHWSLIMYFVLQTIYEVLTIKQSINHSIQRYTQRMTKIST